MGTIYKTQSCNMETNKMTWKNDKHRHSLASRGIKSKQKAYGKRFDTIKIVIPPNTVKIYDEYSMQYDWFEGMHQEDVFMDFMEDLEAKGVVIKSSEDGKSYKLVNLSDKPISYTNHQFYNDNQFNRGEW